MGFSTPATGEFQRGSTRRKCAVAPCAGKAKRSAAGRTPRAPKTGIKTPGAKGGDGAGAGEEAQQGGSGMFADDDSGGDGGEL